MKPFTLSRALTVITGFSLSLIVASCAIGPDRQVPNLAERLKRAADRAAMELSRGDCRANAGDPTVIVDGTPRANPAWEADNLTTVTLPWKAHAAWNPDLRVRTLQVHNLAAPSLERALSQIWLAAGEDQAEIDRVGLSAVGGGYNWRQMRTRDALSTHAHGCAVDFDPVRNGLGNADPHFARPENRYVVEAFRAEGWGWGGNWPHPDGMHFQANRIPITAR